MTFTAHGEQSVVAVEPIGLDQLENALATVTQYDQDWPAVLQAYAGAVTASAE